MNNVRLRTLKLLVVPQWVVQLAESVRYSDHLLATIYKSYGDELKQLDKFEVFSGEDMEDWRRANTVAVFMSIIDSDDKKMTWVESVMNGLVSFEVPDALLSQDDDELVNTLACAPIKISNSMSYNVHELTKKDFKLALTPYANANVGYIVSYDTNTQTILCKVVDKDSSVSRFEENSPTTRASVLNERVKHLLYEHHWQGGVQILSAAGLLNT